MLLNLAGNDFAVGLNWSQIAGANVKEEVQIVVEELGASFGVLREVDRGNHVDRQIGLTTQKSEVGKPSAAALLADAVDQVLLIEEAGPDSVWICVVVDHTVLAGSNSDVVVSREDASETVRGLFFEVLQDVADLRIVAPESLTDLIAVKSEVGNFATLTADISAGKSHRIRRLKGGANPLLLLGGLIIASGALYYVWSASQPSVPEPSLSIDFGQGLNSQAVSDMVQKQGPSQEELLAKAKAEEIEWLTEAYKAAPASQAIQALVAAYANAPRNVAGFDLVGIAWSYETATTVQLVWQRQTEGRSTALRDALPDAIAVRISANGMEATSLHAVSIEPLEMTSILDHLARFRTPIERLVDVLSLHRYTWKTDRYKWDQRRLAIVGIQDSALAQTRQLQLPALEVEVTGTSTARLAALSPLIEQDGQTLQIQQINLKVGAETPWQIKGVMYEAP